MFRALSLEARCNLASTSLLWRGRRCVPEGELRVRRVWHEVRRLERLRQPLRIVRVLSGYDRLGGVRICRAQYRLVSIPLLAPVDELRPVGELSRGTRGNHFLDVGPCGRRGGARH
jgi:hypothetical protein